jgi:pyruvate formate-lyase/glycerol dehydratase family glycyl radical enzyme
MSIVSSKNTQHVEPYAIEPFDRVWGVGISGNTKDPSPFPRINRILSKTQKTTNGFVSPDRAMLVTEAYKKNPGAPQIIKCAEGMANVLRNTPIYIYEDELIVGCLGCDKKGAPVHPEFGLNWVVDEMRDGLMDYSEKRTHDYFSFTKETQEQLESIRDFWNGNTIEDFANSLLTEDELKGSHAGKGVFFADAYMFCGAGHCGIDYDRLFELGFGGIKKLILEQMETIDMSLPEDIKRYNFYKALLIVNEATTEHFMRYARKAKEMAEAEKDPVRKEELLQISANCEWVSTNPPRTFWEAIQLVHLATAIVLIECNGHSISYGRFDQYMYPYYKNDIENGTATREFIQELLENLQVKIWDMNKLRNHVLIKTFGNGGIGGPSLTVGGIDADGRDATNELTFMLLDAHAHTRIPNPWLAVRVHASTPWELKVKTTNLIRLGTGEPKIFNDDVAIPSMLAKGVEMRDARNYQVVGCVEPDVCGKSYGWKDCGHMNLAKVLELAINDGRCIECGPDCKRWEKCGKVGDRLGLRTGSLEDFETFDEVLEAYDRQMKYWADRQVAVLNAVDIAHQELRPLPILSMFMDGCVEKGTDVTAGGTKYNYSGPPAVGGPNAQQLSILPRPRHQVHVWARLKRLSLKY